MRGAVRRQSGCYILVVVARSVINANSITICIAVVVDDAPAELLSLTPRD